MDLIMAPPKPTTLPKQYRCDSGKITRISTFMGIIRFKSDDKNGQYEECLFFLSSYRLKRLRTLCQIFTVGDWVGFVAMQLEGGHWTALDIRPKEDIMSGYGQFKRAFFEQNCNIHFIIRPQFRAPFGGGDVAFYKHAFRKGQRSFDELHDGEWLRFWGMERPDKESDDNYTAMTVEAEIAWFYGLIVMRTTEKLQIWCKEVGLATAIIDIKLSEFKIGNWVQFRIGTQNAEDGQWKAFNVVSAAAPVDVMLKIGKHIRVTAVAIAGVISNRYGTVWNENLGRMNVWRWCLKDVIISPYQRVFVRAFYNKNDDRCTNTRGDAWTVYEIKLAPILKISPFVLCPSIMRNVKAIVEDISITPQKWFASTSLPPCFWRLRSEKYGNIFATPLDIIPIISETGRVITAHLRPGDRVNCSLVPVSLSNVDEYRAFVVEKL